METQKNRAIFLDRDGVINKDKKYIYKIEDFEIFPGVFDSLKNFQLAGFKLIIVTNQSGIAAGYYTENDFFKLNEYMLNIFEKNNIKINEVYFCPHSPDHNCECRKPNIKMINQAIEKFDLDIKECWMIGDKLSDIECGKKAGCKTVLIESEYVKDISEKKFNSLKEASRFILNKDKLFDRTKLKILPLDQRESKSYIKDIAVNSDSDLLIENNDVFEKIARNILEAKKNNKSIIIAFGAHLIKNGMSLVLRKMIENKYVTHLATNGAGSIHDWEIAFQGKTEEDVRKYVAEGKFGIWDETGKFINLAIIHGAKNEFGYGESIGRMISEDKIGDLSIKHLFKEYSIQESAFNNNIQFTIHPGFGYDIIYTHPLSNGESIGKACEIDFLKFVKSVSNLEGGVYISVGSAIMSPMIFEKALSMARNVSLQNGKNIRDFMIVVNDIQEGEWDWNSGKEPDKKNPAYYLRFCKSFNRMNARELYYVKQDNKNFLLSLYQTLRKLETNN